MKKDEIGRTCSVRGGSERYTIFIGKSQGKIPVGNVSIYDERIILKCNLEKYVI
jgi:hypothetical protein